MLGVVTSAAEHAQRGKEEETLEGNQGVGQMVQ